MKRIKSIVPLIVITMHVGLSCAGQGTEGFTGLTASATRYESGSYPGDNGGVWTFSGARSVRSQFQFDEVSIGFGPEGDGARFLETVIEEGGVGSMVYVIGPYFTAGAAHERSLMLWINDDPVRHTVLESMQGFQWVEVKDIDAASPVRVRWESDGSRQLVLDMIAWTAFEPGVDPVDPGPDDPDPVPGTLDVPDPVPLTAGTFLLLRGVQWEDVSPVQSFTGTGLRKYMLPNDGQNLPETIRLRSTWNDSGAINFATSWRKSSWRSDGDFVLRLTGAMGWWRDDSLEWWNLGDFSDSGGLDRNRLLEEWTDGLEFRRLESLYTAVRFALGNFPAVADLRDVDHPYANYLQNGDYYGLWEFLVSGDRFFLWMAWESGHWSAPAIWNQIWLHWTGQVPTAQQLWQMDSRYEMTYRDDDLGIQQVFARYLADMSRRVSPDGTEFVFGQPAPYFENDVIERIIGDLVLGGEVERSTMDGLSNGHDSIARRIHWAMSQGEIDDTTDMGWAGATVWEDDRLWHPVYGWIRRPAIWSEWHFSEDFGWFWAPALLSGTDPWIHLPGRGWVWTSEEVYPWMVAPNDGPVWAMDPQ